MILDVILDDDFGSSAKPRSTRSSSNPGKPI